jgi:hypothetical protein
VVIKPIRRLRDRRHKADTARHSFNNHGERPQDGGIKATACHAGAATGVMAVSTASFGDNDKGRTYAAVGCCQFGAVKAATDIDPPQLPTYTLADRTRSEATSSASSQKPDLIAAQTRVGAARGRRVSRSTRSFVRRAFFGGRQPVQGEPAGVKTNGSGDTRPTGAVVRRRSSTNRAIRR